MRIHPFGCAITLLGVLISTGNARAQSQAGFAVPPGVADAASSPAARANLPQVDITATSDGIDPRDEATMRSVVKRDEIERFGDTSLASVLSRIPGVTVTAGSGKSPEVRLRGLGQGYTRILVNGDAVPTGFSIDSISPANVERIEVLRAARADVSAQAIAGTINLVLKSAASLAERTYQLTAIDQGGRPGGGVDGRWSARDGALARQLSASIQRDLSDQNWTARRTVTDGMGTPAVQSMGGQGRTASTTVNLGAGLQRKVSEGLSWRWDNSMRYRKLRISEAVLRSPAVGAEFDRSATLSGDVLSTTSFQSQASGDWSLAEGAKIEANLSVAAHRRVLDSIADSRDAANALAASQDVDSKARTRTVNSGGKYRTRYVEGHDAVLGWELEDAWRRESRDQVSTDFVAGSSEASDDAYDSSARRTAFYVQDEWTHDKAWSTYVGLRWEGIRTRTTGSGLDAVEQFESVLSPSLQTLLKLPGSSSRQLRLAIGRTYKTPNPRDLIPRQWQAIDNSPVKPDDLGNPTLRPELAWAVDVGYEERKLATVLSTTVFGKYIDDVILRDLFEQDGRWVERKVNGGRAVLYGLEADLRLDQYKLFNAGPNLQWTFYAARNLSRLLDVSSGDRRMDQQAPWIARLGWEHKLDQSQWRWGGQLQHDAASSLRSVNLQTRTTEDRTTLDLYATLVTTTKQSLRISLGNATSSPQAENIHIVGSGFQLDEKRVVSASAVLRATWKAPF